MSKLESVSLVFVVFSLIYFGSPAPKYRLGGIQPAMAIDMEKGKVPAKTVQKNSQQNPIGGVTAPAMDGSSKDPAYTSKGTGRIQTKVYRGKASN
jgi:hypothetical protein